jgi:glycosyltransferase involved in cell wall biosynthesis
VIPNGLPVKEAMNAGNSGDFWMNHPEFRGKRIVLFLGRIHPVKGLDLFARAWSRVAGHFRDWHWVIAGPDEERYKAKLSSLFDQLAVSNRISFLGPVAGDEKEALLEASEFLVLPSQIESFGMVVLEAFLAGTPVMTSRNCPWPELEAGRCGWWVEQNIESWELALRSAMNLPGRDLRDMGLRGRRLVKEKYSEDHLVSSMIGVYEWLLGGKTIPPCVHSACP